MNRTFAYLSAVVTLSLGFLSAAYAATDAQQAIAEYNKGHYAVALAQFVILEKQYPNNSMVHYYTGLCRQGMGQISEARNEYQFVVAHDNTKLKGYAEAGLANLAKSGGAAAVEASAAASSASGTKVASVAPAGKDPEEMDASDLPANASPGVQKAIDMAKKAGMRIGKDGKPIAVAKGAAAGGATPAGAPATPTAAAAGAVPKIAAKPKIKKIIEFCYSNDRTAIAFDETFNSAKSQFADIQFVKMNVDEGSGQAMADKYKLQNFPAMVYLDGSDKVLDSAVGAPMGDAFAEKIRTVNGDVH